MPNGCAEATRDLVTNVERLPREVMNFVASTVFNVKYLSLARASAPLDAISAFSAQRVVVVELRLAVDQTALIPGEETFSSPFSCALLFV